MAGQFTGLDEPAGAEEEGASLQKLGFNVPSNSPQVGDVFTDEGAREPHGSPPLPRFTALSLLSMRDVLKDFAERADAPQRQQDTQPAVPNAPGDGSASVTVEPR